jgi:hypothetical protein
LLFIPKTKITPFIFKDSKRAVFVVRPTSKARTPLSKDQPDRVSRRASRGLPKRRQVGVSGHAETQVRQVAKGSQRKLSTKMWARLLVQSLRKLVKRKYLKLRFGEMFEGTSWINLSLFDTVEATKWVHLVNLIKLTQIDQVLNSYQYSALYENDNYIKWLRL